MSEPDTQHTGDGSDNYADAARKTAEAAKHFGRISAQSAATASGEAATNAAAATVQAAAEGGKAVAEVAAGTAAGGPLGAIIGAAWAMRRTLFKILVVICLSLLFLIVMVVSLPSIVFNSIFHTDPGAAALGSTDMFAIYEEMSAVVSGCVSGGYEYARSEVERIIAAGGYDYDLSMEAAIDYGHVSADYDVCYILAAYSASMEQKGVTKADMKSKLDAVAKLMFPVTYEVKEAIVTIPAVNGDEGQTTEIVKFVQCTIHPFDASLILSAFNIDPGAPYSQFGVSLGDAVESMALALKRTLYGVTASGQVPPITDAELTAFLENLTCSPARKELMRAAMSLVGRVPYFWGGKSTAGWNDEWNTPKLVTSAGSSSTGTLRPYGLDCSGFTDWVYKTALGVTPGSGTAAQWNNSSEITEAELLPGDLGFMERPGVVPINHVLLYAGTDANGKKLWVHCSSSAGGVAVNSPAYIKYYRRVSNIDQENVVIPNRDGG